ncbi:MAG: formyltetrahydrofolate deformylase [Alphaproteobacteria bacterium]|nr:formyltetrahydrofolate deformylase [Alphaproteobacteria bacterium]
MSAAARFILTLSCRDAIGIVAATSTFLADRGLSIEESHQFHDRENDAFYLRAAFTAADREAASLEELNAGFAPIARRFAMTWRIFDAGVRAKIVIAVSRISHCCVDLLHRAETGWLPADVSAIVSNHDDMRPYAEYRRTPFHAFSVTPETKADAEARMLGVLEETGAELLVLARYMQILTPETCTALQGRAINIHHSFLPSFKGARPYHQAHARGVKIIGATAHYVTPDLDEGPIIEQAVERVTHEQSPKDLVEIGRDMECQVLARAVRWHLERRVIINGAKTIVFR